MTSFYLSAVCCIPLPNPAARLRELEVFREVAAQNSQQPTIGANGRIRGRWDGNEKQNVARGLNRP